MESSEINSPLLSPSTLAVMKHQHLHSVDGDIFSQSTAHGGAQKSFDSKELPMRSMSRSSRRVSRSSRVGGSSSFILAHRRQMAAELTTQAESKFLALMELMASASREASSLKESWTRIVSEREAFNAEREELLEQINEVSEELEERSTEHHKHGDELGQRKKQVETLLGELSIAVASVTAEKRRVSERDLELQRTRDGLRLIEESSSRTKIEYEKIRIENETLDSALRAAQADRDDARAEAERHQRELHKITRERTEIGARLSDVTNNFDLSRKEVLSLTDRLKICDLEREESFQDVDRLKEEVRRAKARAEEFSKELVDVRETFERSNRDVHKLRESIRVVEIERDEHAHTIEHKNREFKTLTASRDEAQERLVDLTTKYDHIKRELLTVKEHLRDAELERSEQIEIGERAREQHRSILIERDELKDEINTTRRKADDNHRQITLLTETLRKSEQSLVDMRSDALTHAERIKVIEREREDWRGKHGAVVTELTELHERFVVIQAEARNLSDARDRVRGELQRRNEEFEEITESITSTRDDSAELEFEIESLRTMIRETREQKERAIAARNAADRERDEATAKYEEKCREMERFEESAASHYHAHGRSGGESRVTSSRIVSRSGTTVNNSS